MKKLMYSLKKNKMVVIAAVLIGGYFMFKGK